MDPIPPDRVSPVDTLHRMTGAVDSRRWAVVRDSFAPRVVLDYGLPELLTPDEIVERWEPLLSQFDATEHRLDDERVERPEPARARVSASFVATHRLRGVPGGERWTLTGRYEVELLHGAAGWKISRLRMLPLASSGNDGLLAAARTRAGLPAPAPAAHRVERVSFEVRGEKVVGDLYLPATARAEARLPAVAILATWTSTKEMIVPNYARPLAAAGYAVLAIDPRGFGESEGAERRTESPSRKIEDVGAAVEFLRGHPSVDPGRVGLVGICAAAGYAAAAASQDARVRSLVLVAPWLHDASIVEAVYGGAAGVAERKRLGAAARRRFQETGVIDYVPTASNTDPAAAMFWEGNALDYYLDVRRGGIPQWGNQFAVMAWPEWLEFDGVAQAAGVRQPTLIVHAPTAAIPEGARRFAAALPVRPREVWLEGWTQFDFYDDPAPVSRAVSEAIRHLGETLAP